MLKGYSLQNSHWEFCILRIELEYSSYLIISTVTAWVYFIFHVSSANLSVKALHSIDHEYRWAHLASAHYLVYLCFWALKSLTHAHSAANSVHRHQICQQAGANNDKESILWSYKKTHCLTQKTPLMVSHGCLIQPHPCRLVLIKCFISNVCWSCYIQSSSITKEPPLGWKEHVNKPKRPFSLT